MPLVSHLSRMPPGRSPLLAQKELSPSSPTEQSLGDDYIEHGSPAWRVKEPPQYGTSEVGPSPAKGVPSPASPVKRNSVIQATLRREGSTTIGMRLTQNSPTKSPRVAELLPRGLAAKAGVLVGDTLLTINGIDARDDPKTLVTAIAKAEAITLTLERPPPSERLASAVFRLMCCGLSGRHR